jgi:hypothetical protein
MLSQKTPETSVEPSFPIMTPTQRHERSIQHQTFATQRSHLLEILDRRIRSATTRGDIYLLRQLDVERQALI